VLALALDELLSCLCRRSFVTRRSGCDVERRDAECRDRQGEPCAACLAFGFLLLSLRLILAVNCGIGFPGLEQGEEPWSFQVTLVVVWTKFFWFRLEIDEESRMSAPPGQGTQQQQQRPEIWKLGTFCALMADPFVQDNGQVPVANLASSSAVLELLIHQSPRLERWRETPLMGLLNALKRLASAEVDSSEKCQQFVETFLDLMRNMSPGGLVLVPSGWLGSTTQSSIVLIVERNSDQTYNMVVCNAGNGLNYHPSRVSDEDPTKIKYQTCLPINNIPDVRFLDIPFWTTLFSQYQQASEFHRVEVLYDVLFPWMTGEPTLSGALERAEELEDADWRTPMRSGNSAGWRNLMEAVRYYLIHHQGCSRGEMKNLTTLLKAEMLTVALTDMQEEVREPPNSDQRTLIRMGCSTLSHAVLKRQGVDDRRREQVYSLISTIEQKLGEIEEKEAKQGKSEEETKEEEERDDLFPKPFVSSELVQRDSKFSGIELNEEDVERYAGAAQEARTTLVSDIMQVPQRCVSSPEEAVAVLVRVETVCGELNERCRSGSSFSSRIALQYQVAELIRTVFTEVLPTPEPFVPGPTASSSCIWKNFPSLQLEQTCMRLVHKLTMTYASAWQSFDAPTRGFDSERSVVALTMLAIFDSVLRHDDFGMELANVLNDDGGYCVSTSVCVANLTLYRLASTMELHHPILAETRSRCLDYFESVQKACKFKDLFIFRMPTDKIEIKKYGTTVLFLRKIMERFGYELVPRENPDPPPEIEALMEWMTSPGTPLAQEHPEFGLFRDMACMFKFLATMESRESELQRQRIAPSEYVSWGLSFEDTSMQSNAFHTRRSFFGNSLRWEVLNYRGVDLDTADVQVTAFGDRKFFFGEGSVVHSPADISAILSFSGNHRPTEDDILHQDSLPNFGDTLSRQESEMLLSYLTVPYLRIPLVLAFFATGDRVTYLFNHEIQALLRATLFDSSDWVPEGEQDRISTVPASQGGFQSALHETPSSPFSFSGDRQKKQILGSPAGLLLNELDHAPESTLRPLMKMLRSLNDLAEASVYSPDAALSLYLIELALDVQSFFSAVRVGEEREKEMHEFLTGTCRKILKKWLSEAMKENDIETSCMIHSYLALVWANVKASSLDVDNVSEMLGSLCFVRNWHGFGLGEPSALLGYGSSTDSTAPPEQRLIRFMQAHGVDTSRIAKGSLAKYIGSSRPLYLRIGAKTIRVPSLSNDEEATDSNGRPISKKLLANVPEQKLFNMLQRQRVRVVNFLAQIGSNSPEIVSSTLTRIVRIALDSKGATLDSDVAMEDGGGLWTLEGRGKYVSPDKEMTLDVQGAQIMWRNDELKPLPDSMTQFNDFHAIFGKQQLHCGIVAHQQHRNWIHVVGTQYDLQLWDEPDDADQGVNVPVDVTEEIAGGAGQAPQEELFWTCGVCTYRNGGGSNAENPNACQMCGTPRQQQQNEQGGQEQEEEEDKSPKAIRYRDILYDRVFDPYDEDNVKSFLENADERWMVQLAASALQAHYKEKVPYRVLFPHELVEPTAEKVSLMACVKTEHEVERESPQNRGIGFFRAQPTVEKVTTSTWKEFVLYKERDMMHVFNLISHGRKIYRQLVFSSRSEFGFHGLQRSSSFFSACGDLKTLVLLEESLLVTRNRDGFVETYIPSRLLFGTLPSALLGAYQFWHGGDGIIRGEPMDMDSTWFGSKQIHILKDRTILQKPYSKRKSLNVKDSVLAGTAAAANRRRLVVNDAPTTKDVEEEGEEREFPQSVVLDLCALGFTPAAAKLALSKTNGNSAFAAEWLLNPEHAAQAAAAEDLVKDTQKYRVVSHGIVRIRSSPSEGGGGGFMTNQIGTLGFGQTVTAMERSGNWVRIKNDRDPSKEAWVLAYHPDHGSILEPVDDNEEQDAEAVESEATAEAASKAVATARANFERNRKEAEAEARAQARIEMEELDENDERHHRKLVNLLEFPSRNGPLFKLLSILVKVEDMSHILVWANPKSGQVRSIEMPRLKLRIEPADDRLLLTDQAGWFICETSPRYKKLLDAHALLLMNGQRELQFLVPNHPASRPAVRGRPFNTDILCDRGSFAWLQTMDTRYYLYNIHTSSTFLISQELSASIYLVHLKLLKREYKEAFRLAPTCTVDIPFTPDEGFIWGQLSSSMDDQHPDAHACRLKLSLAIMFAKNHIRAPWEVHLEYDRYLSKLPRVSADCRLTKEEELKILKMTSSGTPLIKNRMTTLTTPEMRSVELRCPAPRVGGAPWNKVQSQSLEYYDAHGTTLKRLHFRPQVSGDTFTKFLTEVVFDEQVVMDEESGVNRQLGFAFLYQLLTTGAGGGGSARSLGEILARYLHLKLSRWGRESVSEGEVEASNSRHMAQLFAVITEPDRPWPQLPVDEQSINLLRNGINLYSEQGRQSSVKMWLDLVDLEFREAWPAINEANDATVRFRPAFVLKDIPNHVDHSIRPAAVSDTGKGTVRVQDPEESAIMLKPLGSLWKDYIAMTKPKSKAPSAKLPFNLHKHSAAQPSVAKDILKRLEDDVKGYAKAFKSQQEAMLQDRSEARLSALVDDLEEMQMQDARIVRDEIAALEQEANRLDDPDFKFSLKTFAHLRDRIDFALLTQALLSTNAIEDILKINPTLSNAKVEELVMRTIPILVKTNRISHANRTALLAKKLKSAQKSAASGAEFRAEQLAKSLAQTLATQRFYLEKDGSFDPRFLVFEYVFDIVLRDRQVEIVRAFADDVKNGRSHVQQMIMGAGKTTVVAPLLTLLLADGDTLVTQVMPTALLEQTRQIMRSRFAAIITKRVFTLEFDRSAEDSPDIARAVFDKLNEARESRSVVVASPDAVKSLFLKFVEHIHSLESVDPEVLLPSTSLRQNKEIVQLRDVMQSRSDMADAMIPIFDMWKQGVLIMDEVDVLLHPLRSELNFPIGLKDPIDMSGFRWDLPIHLLSAFFPETRDGNELANSEALAALLQEIDTIVEEGYREHSLQRNPHLVLLDEVFYRTKLMRPAAEWCYAWLRRNTHDLQEEEAVIEYLCAEELWANKTVLDAFEVVTGDNMKMLNLGRDWIRVLLPHVLSKIDRVSFGILSPIDLANIDQKTTPLSRKLMAVPFVGKDVPSRSSEFAHPDVVIGLTILGFRYEGLRLSDVRTIVTQLKADFSREVGPRDSRPSSMLFRSWLEHASRDLGEQLPVLPLPLFQVNDPKQLERLYQLLRKEDRVITYYLRQHVFPACMNFQSIKISASGHELGSTLLFSKRIGFSGTPSNLLPNDLGECLYEPGSDGKIMHVLSSEEVVTVERKSDWTAKSLLRDVALSTPPIHALIDTGALITGMDNEQVAHYLLEYLPASRFEGVVYLDRSDRKMFLQRSSGKSLLLSQCGVDPSRRFTFYDQVHTTGMDIKQTPDAVAVVTVGKDMTFRDYAQGSFRMREIGNGQKIQLYLIPEVEQLIKNELFSGKKAAKASVKALDIPAWLLINSMRMEAIQYSMLSLQELFNCWRKVALQGLVDDCKIFSPLIEGAKRKVSREKRLRRFMHQAGEKDSEKLWLRKCINLFREPVGFTVPESIPAPQPFHEKVKVLIADNKHFIQDKSSEKLVKSVADRVKFTKDIMSEELEAEIVNENEQEQQQQQEEEAEEEQEKVSRYTRDDEQANPWQIAQLNKEPSGEIGEEPFYPFQDFAVRERQPRLSFPDNLLLSDNWFRPRWIGLGDRRLKNIMVVLEWSPKSFTEQLGKLVPLLHQHLISEEGLDANSAAARALTVATAPQSQADFALRWSIADRLPKSTSPHEGKRFVVLSLAEAETLRRVLHTPQAMLTSDYALLSIEDGSAIDSSPGMELEREEGDERKKLALTCLRFVNCDMHYTEEELELLGEAFSESRIPNRIQFFEDCLRLRRREKYMWGDTPLAKLFTDESEWHLLDARAKLQQMSATLLRLLKAPRNSIDLLTLFSRMDSNNDSSLSRAELQRMIENLRLGFSPADIALVVKLVDSSDQGEITWAEFIQAFNIPEELATIDEDRIDLDAERKNQMWQCANCTFLNLPSSNACEICNYGWDGRLVVPSDKWICDPEYGGCTFFNDESAFYCSVCDKAKPSLMNVRF